MIRERLDYYKGSFPDQEIHNIASTISHELRTPLNAIIGFSELIQEETSICHIKQYAKIIKENGQSLVSRIQSIIDYNLIEYSKDICLDEINLNEFLTSILNESRYSDQEYKFELELIVSEETVKPIVFTDANKLEIIIFQLMYNARKFFTKSQVQLGYSFTSGVDSCSLSINMTISDACNRVSPERLITKVNQIPSVNQLLNESIDEFGIGLAICYKLSKIIGIEIIANNNSNQLSYLINIPNIEYPYNTYLIKSCTKTTVVVADDDNCYYNTKERLDKCAGKILRLRKLEFLLKLPYEKTDIDRVIITVDPIKKRDSDLIKEVMNKYSHIKFLFNNDIRQK